MSGSPSTDDPVWYLAYGSNMCAARFGCYLAGGRPPGGARTYEGSRDPSPPRSDVALRLDGGLAFAGLSTVWGGGIAFYDPAADGRLAARAYLVTFGQLSDVVAQETRQPLRGDLRLDRATARSWRVPAEVYETVLYLDDRDGVPMFTITSMEDQALNPPTAPYLRTVLRGLGETFDWSPQTRAEYLLRAAGVAPRWDADQLVDLCDGGSHPGVSHPNVSHPARRSDP